MEPSEREKELEKKLEKKGFQIISLENQLSELSKKQAQQDIKYRNACELRDELTFKVSNLEGQVQVLKRENNNLKSSKGSREITLENLLGSYENQIKEYKQQLEINEEKMKTCNNMLENKQVNELNESLKRIAGFEETVSKDKEKLQAYELKISEIENELKEKTSTFIKEQNTWKTKETNLTENLRKCEEKLQEENHVKSVLLKKLKTLEMQEKTDLPENTHLGVGIAEIKNVLEQSVTKPLQESNRMQIEIFEHLRNMGQRISSLEEKINFVDVSQLESKSDVLLGNELKPKVESNEFTNSRKTKKTVKQEKSKENISNATQKRNVKQEKSKENIPDVTPQKRTGKQGKSEENVSNGRLQKRTVLREKHEENLTSDVPPQKEKPSRQKKKGALESTSSTNGNIPPCRPKETSATDNVANVKGQKERKLRPRNKT